MTAAHHAPPPRRRVGFTLAELMIAIAIFGVVLTTAVGFLVAQSKAFRTLANKAAAVQNGRFGRDVLRQEIRTAGTNVTDEQPTVVYASDSAFAFNADLTTNRQDSVRYTGAVYVDPYAPTGEVTAITTTTTIAIPGSSPSFSYPLQNYSQTTALFINSDAELVSFRFAKDTTTGAPSGTYLLYRQVNGSTPQIVASGLSRSQSKPFFRYWYDPTKYNSSAVAIDTVPRAWLPLAKTVARRGIAPDTGTATTTRIDALRAVEVTYEATPPQGGTRQVVRYLVPMPNLASARQARACGRVPVTPTTPSATWRVDSNAVMVTWARATDDGAGEKDAIRYVMWRQLNGAASWGDPITTIGVAASGSYAYKDASVTQGSSTVYRYAIALQDCTPNVSGLAISPTVTVP